MSKRRHPSSPASPLKRTRAANDDDDGTALPPPPSQRTFPSDWTVPRRSRQPSATRASPPSPAASASEPPTTTTTNPFRPINVLSWNMDGLRRHLPHFDRHPSGAQRTIDAFFRSGTPPDSNSTDRTAQPASAARPLRALLRRTGYPDVVCLQELQIFPSDTLLISELERAVQPRSTDVRRAGPDEEDTGPRYRVYTNLYAARSGRARFGIATLVSSRLVSRFPAVEWSGVDWDDEGRVGLLRLGAIEIYNIYAPNSSSYVYTPTHPTSTATTRHARKLEFQALLAAHLAPSHPGTRALLLCGDFNVTPSELDAIPSSSLRTAPAHLEARVHWTHAWTTMHVVDLWRRENPHARGTASWFKDREKRAGVAARVDYELVDRSWAEGGGVKGVRYFPDEGEGSDHCPFGFTIEQGG